MNKKLGYVVTLILCCFSFISAFADEVKLVASKEEVHEAAEHAGNHAEGISGIVFIILAVLIGSSFRFFFRKSVIPFTVILLLVGIGLGVLFNRMEFVDESHFSFLMPINDSLGWAADINPHLLLFVFLPILIFEAAFNMDLHVFKKTAVNSMILSIPGIVIALGITAVMVMCIKFLGLGLDDWTWQIALMFGAVISATDPVAVVAILKELGASKKLGTLIEGESLLNDGTSIVIFMVFLSILTGVGGDTNGFVQFIQVSVGGTVVGLVVGWIVLRWISRVFNDALIEITAVIGAAFLTYHLAENVFHVSGVLSLVALGLMIGGYGKSKISPNVEHFMEEFWELAGFIANCIIFLIVGIIIATKSNFTLQNVLLVILIYIIIHIARAAVIAMFFPLMKRSGYGLSKKEAIVLWFGGLRGAVGLSLGLIILGVDDQYLSPSIKDEIFFLISGTVTLTLLVNATTTATVINKLGLTKLSVAKKLINAKSSEYLTEHLKNYLEEIKSNRYLKKAEWNEVESFLPEVETIKEDQVRLSYMRKLAETRIRLLEKEKSSYWHQFKSGLIGAGAIQKLSDSINHIIDKEGMIPLSERSDLEISWSPSKWLDFLAKFFITRGIARTMILNRLYDSYDAAVSFVVSQKECLSLLEDMKSTNAITEDEYVTLEDEMQNNLIQANTFLRNLRRNHEEIYQKINTRQATRIMINAERNLIKEMEEKGMIDDQAAAKMNSSLEVRDRKATSKQA